MHFYFEIASCIKNSLFMNGEFVYYHCSQRGSPTL